jgi:hypothetical protein
MPTIGNITVGKPDTTPDAPAHTPGVRQGNAPPRQEREPRAFGVWPLRARGLASSVVARRFTGVSPQERQPIDPRMPNVSPA